MPGLLRGVARTAVVAGTATAVNGRVARRQAERYADRDAQIYAQREHAYEQQVHQQPVPSAQVSGSKDHVIEQLKELGALRDQGVLTDDELAAQKARILSNQ